MGLRAPGGEGERRDSHRCRAGAGAASREPGAGSRRPPRAPPPARPPRLRHSALPGRRPPAPGTAPRGGSFAK